MSISATFSSALSGLAATSRMAEVTASNISNALTEGYARREAQVSSRVVGSTGVGVTIDGVTRHVDKSLLQDLRQSIAGQSYQQARSGFLSAVEKTYGTPDAAGSLSARISGFERSLIEAASRPDSDARLATVADSANAVIRSLSDASRTIQEHRQRADTRIALEVGQLNDALVRVANLNIHIREATATGRETAALMDQRQQLVDTIAAIVPVKEIPRGRDEIALYTSGGTVLLEGRPMTIAFDRSGVITADMTLQGGALSGLSINGQPVTTGPNGGRLGEGSLTAQFEIRDRIAPDAQAQLDAVARDLVERFAAPGLDPTVAPGAPGLFTDRGLVFAPANEPGLAGRLVMNAVVMPEQGGAYWRLREGLGAATPQAPGAAGQLSAWTGALVAKRVPVSGSFGAGGRGFATLASELISGLSVKRLSVQSEAAFAAARSSDLKSAMLRNGVDTDTEMQNLMQIEKAYAANAKVIKTADDMLQVILGI